MTALKIVAAAATMLLSGATIVMAQQSNVLDLGIHPDKEIVAEQYLILGDATRGSGESQVAINLLDPNNIVIAAMSVINSNEGKFEHTEVDFKRTTRAVITQFAVSHDRGLTWSVIEDPMRDYYHRYRCLDPFADFTPDGMAIVGCEAQRPTSFDSAQQIDEIRTKGTATYGGPALITSTDNGRTWGAPIQVLGNPMPKEVFGPFVSFNPDSTWADAPKIHVDASTGKIFVSGTSRTADAPVHSQMVIRMSKDHGRDWSMVYAVDSADWPQGGRASYDVANGVVAAAYIASKAPASANAKCPCWVLGLSKDDGATFDRRAIPVPAGGGDGDPFGGGIYADPSKPGHYLFLGQTGPRIVVYQTADMGATWSPERVVGEVPGATVANLTGRFGADGTFAVSWRAMFKEPGAKPPVRPGIGANAHIFSDSPTSSEIWSVLSRDGGRTFSQPLKVSTARSPQIPRRRGSSNHSADFDSVALDKDFVHMSWFDARSGFLGTWYGRVPLNDYKFSR